MSTGQMNRRELLALPLAAALGGSALAQGRYPDRPIRLVIPFPPGGVYDAVGRPWADKMKSLLGNVVVENIGGAGGSLGAAAVARAQPDGYTLLLGGGGPLVVNPLASSRTSYEPIKDFEAISIVTVTTLALAVHPSLPIHSMRELIDYAKANPGKLSYGSAGVGTFNHLTAELFKSLTGTNIVHIPYRGAGPAISDLVGGQIPMITPNVTGQVIELHQSGKLRMLTVTSPKRLIGAPQIPTAVEEGLPGMVSQNFIGLFAPARTARAIVEQVSQATHKAFEDQEFQKLYIAAGNEPYPDMSPDAARQFLEADLARWSPIIKAIDLKLD
jgi:tripartite-type tricarboxylate transporter receptor subunit TctC